MKSQEASLKNQHRGAWSFRQATGVALGLVGILTGCTPLALTTTGTEAAKPAKAGEKPLARTVVKPAQSSARPQKSKPGSAIASAPTGSKSRTGVSKSTEPPVPPLQSLPERKVETLYVAKGEAKFIPPSFLPEEEPDVLTPKDADLEKARDKKEMRSMSPIIALEIQAEKLKTGPEDRVGVVNEAFPAMKLRRGAMLEALLGQAQGNGLKATSGVKP